MTDPEVIADMKKFVALNKEYKELQPVVEASEKYRTALNHLSEAKEILATEKDDELREMFGSFCSPLYNCQHYF